MTTARLDFDDFTLTNDQQVALDGFYNFLLDPTERVWVLQGGAGCGKSTLVWTMLDRLPSFQKTIRLINPSAKDIEVMLTATTHKAAENLSRITGMEVSTIHSALGLRVVKNPRTGETTLQPHPKAEIVTGKLVWVDEASILDSSMLGHLFSRTHNCKIVLVGDPYQLIGVKATNAPAFEAGFKGAALNEVVRQKKPDGALAALHPITEWATQLKETVKTGIWTPFKPDGFHIQRLSRPAFDHAIELEFTRTNWRYADSKILAWTNKRVIDYNNKIRSLMKGDPSFQVGDYAVCNSYVQAGRNAIKTDELVLISKIEPEETIHGVRGSYVWVNGNTRVFKPNNLAEWQAAVKRERAAGNISHVVQMDGWIDLRGAAAQTTDKSQGSTYDQVFIDLDDMAGCHNMDRLARMLYVSVSRARNHVFLTGDLA